MGAARWRSLESRLRDALARARDRAALSELLYPEIGRYVRFDFGCFATTDPASGVITWASKTRSLGVGDEEFAATEYGPADINKFEEIATRRPSVGALSLDTDGHPERCRRHRDFMSPRFGFTDELRAAFVSRGTAWGVLALYRAGDAPSFSIEDVQDIAGICDTVAAAIQRCLFQVPAPVRNVAGGAGPAVLVVDATDRVTHSTPGARAAIEELGGWEHGQLPSCVLAVIASVRAGSEHVSSRTPTTSGSWITLLASMLDDRLDGRSEGRDVVVSIEPTPRAALSHLALAAFGLTRREVEVALLVLQGANTENIARTLHLSPHTVQDHLEAIFAKVGVRSRRELIAKLVLT